MCSPCYGEGAYVRLSLDIDRSADKLLVLLVATNLFLLFLDVFHFFTGVLGEPIFDLETNAGLGHTFRYFQELWIVLMFGAMALRKWRFLCISWALLFMALLVDDSISLHEWLGLLLSQRLNLPSVLGLRPEDLGEMIVYGSWGVTLTLLTLVAHWVSREDARQFSGILLGLLVLLVIAGPGMDTIEGMIHQVWIHAALGKVEEGGSMMVVSVFVWYLIRQDREDVKAA
jgi:hypothetical protein